MQDDESTEDGSYRLSGATSVVELMDSLMPGTDKDLLRPFMKIIKSRYEAIIIDERHPYTIISIRIGDGK